MYYSPTLETTALSCRVWTVTREQKGVPFQKAALLSLANIRKGKGRLRLEMTLMLLNGFSIILAF